MPYLPLSIYLITTGIAIGVCAGYLVSDFVKYLDDRDWERYLYEKTEPEMTEFQMVKMAKQLLQDAPAMEFRDADAKKSFELLIERLKKDREMQKLALCAEVACRLMQTKIAQGQRPNAEMADWAFDLADCYLGCGLSGSAFTYALDLATVYWKHGSKIARKRWYKDWGPIIKWPKFYYTATDPVPSLF